MLYILDTLVRFCECCVDMTNTFSLAALLTVFVTKEAYCSHVVMPWSEVTKDWGRNWDCAVHCLKEVKYYLVVVVQIL